MSTTSQTILITGGSEEHRHQKAHEIAKDKIGVHALENCTDFVVIETDEERNSIGIDKARNLKEWVTTTSIKKHKVAYIRNAHHLTPEAQNALLKLLEEPPASSSIILTTSHHHSLLPTVISRCLRHELKTPGIDLSSLPKPSTSEIIALIKASVGERIDWREKQKKLPEDDQLVETLNEWLLIIRDCCIASATNKVKLLAHPQVEEILETSKLLPAQEWQRIADSLLEALRQISTSKADRKSILDVLLLSLPTIE